MKITIHDAEHWITVHPNGNKEEKGTPLLIEGSNGHYVVKGGAGGKLNGKTVTPKSMSKPRGGSEGSNGGGEPASGQKPTGGLGGSIAQPAEGKPDNPKTEVPAGKKTAVKVGKEGDKSYSPVSMELEIGGENRRVTLNHAAMNNGVAEYAKDWLEKNADRFKNDGYGLSTLRMCYTVEQAKEVLKEYELKQLINYGDQRLPEEKREQSKVDASKEYERLKEEHREAEEKKREQTTAAMRSKLEAKNAKENERIAKQRQITKREAYKPAATVAAAKTWALKNNLADRVDYTGLSTHVANGINESLSATLNDFPELRTNMGFCGSGAKFMRSANDHRADKERMRLAAGGHNEEEVEKYIARSFKKERVPANCFAFAAQRRFDAAGGVGFHDASSSPKEHDNLMRTLAHTVETNWSPIGCGTVKATMDHELGHMIDHLLGMQNDPEFNKIYRDAKMSEGGIEKAVGRYALKNGSEFLAEAWAEYRNNPNPRPTAQAVGDLMRRRYAEKFGKRT